MYFIHFLHGSFVVQNPFMYSMRNNGLHYSCVDGGLILCLVVRFNFIKFWGAGFGLTR